MVATELLATQLFVVELYCSKQNKITKKIINILRQKNSSKKLRSLEDLKEGIRKIED